MNCIGCLLGSFGEILEIEGLDIGHHRIHCACLKIKEALVLDLFMKCSRHCLQSCGEIIEQNTHCGLIL